MSRDPGGPASRQSRAVSRHQGQGLVEFALVVPIILLGFLISVDFGRVIYAQNVISQNAVNAARSASAPDFCVSPSCNNATQEDAKIRQVARTLSPLVAVPDSAIHGETDPPCSDSTPGPFMTTDGTRVVVEIKIPVPLITPIISTIVGNSITVCARGEELLKG